MRFLTDIQAAPADPARLEALFQQALADHARAEFRSDMQDAYAAAPENLLYAAWHHRFQHSEPEAPVKRADAERRGISWAVALPLSLVTGLLLWALSGNQFVFQPYGIPYLGLLAAPIVGLAVIAFLRLAAHEGYARALAAGGLLAGVVAYAFWLALTRPFYRDLMVPHLFLLSWAAVAISLVGVRSSAAQVFAFLIKSIEAVVTGGVYLIASLIFAGIVLQMFQALGLAIPDWVNRLLFVGTGGLVPVLAVASMYNPQAPPLEQDFKRGVGRLIITFPRILLGLTLIVLVVYVAAIPFNFMAPFRDREVLIAYNVMLFAVLGLLVGATPVEAGDLSPAYQRVLRAGILAVAGLVAAVSIYALAAVLYRTFTDVMTINRLTVIGWNCINVAILLLLLFQQLRLGARMWTQALQAVFRTACVGYVAWALFITLATPWLF